jgi:hypothetical protein
MIYKEILDFRAAGTSDALPSFKRTGRGRTMKAALAETVIGRQEIGSAAQSGDDRCIFDEIVEVDSPEDDMTFVVIDCIATLLVYLAPVAVFGYKVAPVVATLLSMPVPR